MTKGKDEYITVRELILKISEWLRYLLLKWKIIVIGLVIGALLGLTLSLVRNTKYVAELTFVLEGAGANASSMGMYAGIAQQFGFNLGDGGGNVFSSDNFAGLLQSRLLIERVLLSPLDSAVGRQSLANYFLETHHMWKKWDLEEEKNSIFPPSVSRDSLPLKQSRVLKKLHSIILEDHLIIEKAEKTSFVLVKCIANDELFSKIFVERLMKEAVDFYTGTKTRRARESITKLQDKADSIEAVLNKQTYTVASSQDLNRNPARQVATVGVELAMRDQQILQSIYAEVMKNLEISKISLLKDTPLIQIIDSPVLPLKRESASPVVWGIGGALIGAFLFSFVLLVNCIYSEIMKS